MVSQTMGKLDYLVRFFKGTTNTSRPSDFYRAGKKILKKETRFLDLKAISNYVDIVNVTHARDWANH